jgi:hypothetical protein
LEVGSKKKFVQFELFATIPNLEKFGYWEVGVLHFQTWSFGFCWKIVE